MMSGSALTVSDMTVSGSALFSGVVSFVSGIFVSDMSVGVLAGCMGPNQMAGIGSDFGTQGSKKIF